MKPATVTAFPSPAVEQPQTTVADNVTLLTDGVNSSLTLLGRTLHVQTEIRNGLVCTEIFSGGRLIARRQERLDPSQYGDGVDAQRSHMKSLHQRTIGRAQRRASSLRKQRQTSSNPDEVNLTTDLGAELAAELDAGDEATHEVKILTPDFPGQSTHNQEQSLSNSVPPAESPPAEPIESHRRGSQQENERMAKVNLEALTAIDGFVGACLVDSDSGMMLGSLGGGPVNLELAAAGNTQVVRAKRKTMSSLQLDDNIEDILISLGKQYHLIRPLESNAVIFLYVVLDREKANLAMARHELRDFSSRLRFS